MGTERPGDGLGKLNRDALRQLIGAKLEINVGQFDLMTAQQLAVRITIALAELHGPALVLDGALECPPGFGVLAGPGERLPLKRERDRSMTLEINALGRNGDELFKVGPGLGKERPRVGEPVLGDEKVGQVILRLARA